MPTIQPLRSIGEAARDSGVSAKMIRYYEEIGLIEAPVRSEAGYRFYAARDVHILRFIRSARDLGFSVEQISELLALWRDRDRHSAQVKALVNGHVSVLRQRIAALQAMVATLESLSECCHGDDRPDCPILEGFEAGVAAPASDGEAAEATRSPRFGAVG